MKMLRIVVLGLTAALSLGFTSIASAAQKSCGRHIDAGKNTSCELARGLYKKIGRDSENVADGRRGT